MSEQDDTQAQAPAGQGSPGAGDEGEDRAGRRSGTSDAEDYTGVDPQEPIDPDSPTLQSGGG